MTEQRDPSRLEDHLGYWMRFVSNHVSHAFMKKVEARGVTVAEWAAMRQMLELGPTSPSQLAERMGMTRGAISRLVERLNKKSLVARHESDGDRRSHKIALTAAGRKLVPILARLADENDRQFFGHLKPPQRSELSELLQDIVHRHGWKEKPVR